MYNVMMNQRDSIKIVNFITSRTGPRINLKIKKILNDGSFVEKSTEMK
jgi:hypothetical protein